MSIAYIRNIFDYRNLIVQLSKKEIKIKYKSALLGWIWSLLNPMLLMAVFSFVFTYIIRIDIKNFPLFLLSGLFPWFFLSMCLTSACGSIIENASLIKKAFFPYEAIPLSVIMSNLFNFLISMCLLTVFLCCFGIFPKLSWFAALYLIFMQTVFITGLCLAVSALNTMYRDIRYIVELLLLVWFYATPIFYKIEFVPERFRFLFQLNPMSLFIDAFRSVLIEGAAPDIMTMGIIGLIAFSAWFAGMLIFNSYKPYFADHT